MAQEDDYIKVHGDGKLILPSQVQEHNKHKIKALKRKKVNIEKRKKQAKWALIIGAALAIYVFYDSIILYLMDILKTNPTIYNYYLLMEAEIKNNTLKGLFVLSIMGSLFFLVLPSEALFIYYLSQTKYNVGTVMILTIAGTLVGFTINYMFGRILGEKVIRFLFKKNFEKYKDKIVEYGGYVLVVGCIFPGPIEMLAVFYGGFKFGYFRYLYLVFIGRLIKYLLLLIAFYFFWDQIMFYYNNAWDSLLTIKSLFI